MKLEELPLLKYGDLVVVEYDSSQDEIGLGFPHKRRESGFVVGFYERDNLVEVARNDPYPIAMNPDLLPPLNLMPELIPGGSIDKSQASKRNAKLDIQFYSVEGIQKIEIRDRRDTTKVVYDPKKYQAT